MNGIIFEAKSENISVILSRRKSAKNAERNLLANAGAICGTVFRR